MLSPKHLDRVCEVNSDDGSRCRYLGQADHDPSKWICGKLSSRRAKIDAEIEDELKEMKRKGKDPRKEGYPLGDNCKGYPLLLHVEQGYDVDRKP